jgi:hypothetical protein
MGGECSKQERDKKYIPVLNSGRRHRLQDLYIDERIILMGDRKLRVEVVGWIELVRG